ncbi:MAG TPA: hypothetical protein V6D15_08495 [Oculatellaceae cyanobacterium]|jgi:hypothetical protein
MLIKDKNNFLSTPSIAPLSPAAQGIDGKYQKGDRTYPPPLDFEKLNTLIASRRLTDCLETLEACDFRGAGALYVIEFMQCKGEA